MSKKFCSHFCTQYPIFWGCQWFSVCVMMLSVWTSDKLQVTLISILLRCPKTLDWLQHVHLRLNLTSKNIFYYYFFILKMDHNKVTTNLTEWFVLQSVFCFLLLPKWRQNDALFLTQMHSGNSWIKALLHEVVSNMIKERCVFWQ